MLPARDAHLGHIVDAATADAARRAGAWLLCAPGCTQCCMGVFPVTQLDAARLREGLAKLTVSDPERAAAVESRAAQAVARLTPDFPGDRQTGILDPEQAEAFEEFANDEPCPALDPATGRCDLYAARPMTCRVFGPPLRTTEGLGVCELCFVGAREEDIESCELHLETDGLEAALNTEAEEANGISGATIVAWALRPAVARQRTASARATAGE